MGLTRILPIEYSGTTFVTTNIASFVEITDILRCPRTGARLRHDVNLSRLVSEVNGISYGISHGIPVLIDFPNSVVPENAAMSSLAPRSRGNAILKRIINGRSGVTLHNCETFLARVKERSSSPTVLVVGGGTIGDGAEPLYSDKSIKVISFDIYISRNLTVIADAHRIPLRDACIDGVWIQAVLEHVLEPHVVVDEIWRVLKSKGVVYAETPFMQMVHEGAYDISRFSELGHRYLFRRFELLASGCVAGPSTVLRWALRYFVAALFRSRTLGMVAWIFFFWLRYLDRLIPRAHASDGASCVYFLGYRSDTLLPINRVYEHYRGAQG
jgi:SAM-dependent methyltransferase